MNAVNSPRQFLVIATAGHVDHGKTSLVKQLTGTDTDTLAEEKARGLTINAGFAYRHSDDETQSATTLGFVDVPGHSDFINNMLAGVSAVNAALLVVAADDGIMPQTREHLAILDLLGINKGAVALTKIDQCTQERLLAVESEISALLARTRLSSAPLFRINNVSGAGVAELATHLNTLALQQKANNSSREQHPRFSIDRCFTAKGIGTIVTGTLAAGTINQGEQLVHCGTGEPVRIRGIRIDQSECQSLHAGQRAALSISLGLDEIKRGDFLGVAQRRVMRFDTHLTLIDPTTSLKSGVDYHLHIGAAHRLARLRKLDETTGLYQFSLDEPITCHWGDRFILRDPAAKRSLGGGTVIDTELPKRGRASLERLALLRAYRGEIDAAIDSALAVAPFGIDLEQFALARNLTFAFIETHLERVRQQSPAPLEVFIEDRRLPRLVGASAAATLKNRLTDLLGQFHVEKPSEAGLLESAIARALRPSIPSPVLKGFITALASKGVLRREGSHIALATHHAEVSRERQEFDAKIAPLLEHGDLTPPRTREIVDATGIPLRAVERILQHCARAGVVVKVADNRFYPPATLAKLAETANQLMAASNGAGFSVIEFRDKTGMGRNLCIEVLEHFDGCGYTLRKENVRVIRKSWSEVAA
jgi:selenocysteine-specific elongation factor